MVSPSLLLRETGPIDLFKASMGRESYMDGVVVQTIWLWLCAVTDPPSRTWRSAAVDRASAVQRFPVGTGPPRVLQVPNSDQVLWTKVRRSRPGQPSAQTRSG